MLHLRFWGDVASQLETVIHIHVYICIYIYDIIHIHTCMHVYYIYICMRSLYYIHTYIHTYIYTHTCTYIHTLRGGVGEGSLALGGATGVHV
jgi:hypothetical protein